MDYGDRLPAKQFTVHILRVRRTARLIFRLSAVLETKSKYVKLVSITCFSKLMTKLGSKETRPV